MQKSSHPPSETKQVSSRLDISFFTLTFFSFVHRQNASVLDAKLTNMSSVPVLNLQNRPLISFQILP